MANILNNVTLYQGHLGSNGTFTSSGQYVNYYVRTGYIDITNYSSISASINTASITVSACAMYDKNKKFIKEINIETKQYQKFTCNKEDNVAYIVFDMGDYNLKKKITPNNVSIDMTYSTNLYQGYIEENGSFSSQTTYNNYHKTYIRTDYLDVTKCNSASIDILTEGVIISYCGLYDQNKKFIKYIDLSAQSLQKYTWNKEDNVSYIALDMEGSSSFVLPSDISININFDNGIEVTEIKNIRVGNSVIQYMYLGNSKVVKMYLGNNLIFGKVN